MIFTIRSAYFTRPDHKPCDKAFFDEERNIWSVEINTLEELLVLWNEIANDRSDKSISFDGLIIGGSGVHRDKHGRWIKDESLGILIYDDCIE